MCNSIRLRRTRANTSRFRSDREPPLFAQRHEADAKLVGQRRTKKKPTRVDADDFIDSLLRNWCRKISTEARNNTPSFRIGVISLKIIPVFGKSGTSRTAACSLESVSSAIAGADASARTERSNAVQLVAKRSARFTLLHDGSTAPDFRDGLLSGGGNQNRYFVSCPHLSTEPICFPNNRAWFRLQTAFLSVRGHALGSCPITNLFEVLVFLAWSIALIYLLIGTTYRLSLMARLRPRSLF